MVADTCFRDVPDDSGPMSEAAATLSSMTPRTPNPTRHDLHSYLGDFFARRGSRLRGLRLQRLQSLESALHECIETECDDLLAPEQLTLVRLERQLEPGCAFARLTPPRLLPGVLRRFLAWTPSDPVNRRLQFQVLAALLNSATADRALVPGEDRLAFFIEVTTLEVDISRLRAEHERARRMAAASGQAVTAPTHATD
jgi:hypothetical protein